MPNADLLFTQVKDAYKELNSVKEVAKRLNLSVVKVRRVLITLGLWESRSSKEICALQAKGYTTEEIANTLHMTVKNVQAYLPYNRGAYNGSEPSNEAVRSKLYRERINAATDNMRKNIVDVSKKKRPVPSCEETNPNIDKLTGAIHLRLELQLPELTDNEKHILQKYGKVEKGITRDILVPSNMRLYALFFTIQKSFGLLNEHLHYFSLPEKVFNHLTHNGNFKEYCKLCGQYFRFPTDDYEDLYWYCDYDENISVKNWFKKKYTAPYIYKGWGDYYLNCQKDVANFMLTPPFIDDTATLAELIADNIELVTANSLLERLPIKCILTSNANSIDWSKWQQAITEPTKSLFIVNPSPVTDHIIYTYDDTWKITVTCINEYYKSYDEDYNKPESFISIKDNRTITAPELLTQLQQVTTVHAPICISKDGIELVENVGGIYGFIEFLEDIHNNEDKDKIKELRDWARSLGWTGRKIQEKHTL